MSKKRKRKTIKDVVIGKAPSPVGGRRACLCDDNTYHIDCCDGDIWAQGIGNIGG